MGACLAWLGFGALTIRYALDPYRPGQGAAPLPVYLVALAFIVVSLAAQVYLYRRWWPPLAVEGEAFRPEVRWRARERPEGDPWLRWSLVRSRLPSFLRRRPPK